MSKIIISDTSCLIALDRINKLDILQKIFPVILTTKDVQEEFGKELPSWIFIAEAKNSDKKKELEKELDKGEASAIALAIEIQNSVLIIDEKKGRKIAQELNLEIIGTLKVLLLAKQKGILHNLEKIFKLLEQKNFRFKKTLVDDILKEANKK